MDLGENPTLHADTSLENGTTCATATALAQVLDSQAISSTSLATFSVTSVPGSTGLAVLTPTLDGTTTVTSLPGFTLSSFDSVDVKHVGDSSELAVATVGEDGRFVPPVILQQSLRFPLKFNFGDQCGVDHSACMDFTI